MMNDPIKDSEISALYREGAKAEPAPALDATLRAAAREALTERPAASLRPQPWWQRWRLPVGVFATLVLTFSLTLLVERERARDLEPAPPAVPAPAPVEERAAPVPAAADDAQQQRAAPPQKSAPAIRRDVVPQEPRPAEAAATAAATAPAAQPPLPTSPPALGGVAAPAAAEQRSGVEMLKARPAAEGTMSDRVAPAGPQMKREAKAAVPAARSPEAWLEDIRRLRREGRPAEAQVQLEEFRRAHPDYVLPDDLKR
jgi:hypothetical protein